MAFENLNNSSNKVLLGSNYNASQEAAPRMNTSMNQQTFGSDLQKKSGNYDTYFSPGYENKVGNITFNNGQKDVSIQKVTGAIPGMKIGPDAQTTGNQISLNPPVNPQQNNGQQSSGGFGDIYAKYSGGVGGSAPVITWDKDGYISNRNNALRELADQAYNSEANAALNTQIGSITDAQQLYNDTASGVQNSQEEARQNYLNSIASANQNAYNALSQTNEAAASRGLSNSGLGMALSQSQYTQLNANLAQIDTEYNSEVQRLNRELSDAVKRFGLSKSEADKIYNNTMQTLEENRNSKYREALDTATTESMQYQLEVDKTNANNATAIAQAQIAAAGSIRAAIAGVEAQVLGEKLGTEAADARNAMYAAFDEANLGQEQRLVVWNMIGNSSPIDDVMAYINGNANTGAPASGLNKILGKK